MKMKSSVIQKHTQKGKEELRELKMLFKQINSGIADFFKHPFIKDDKSRLVSLKIIPLLDKLGPLQIEIQGETKPIKLKK